MKFNLIYRNEVCAQAAKLVSTHYKDEKFLWILAEIEYFEFSEDTGKAVAIKIQECNVTMNVKGYRAKWIWSSVIGHAKGLNIYINTRKKLALKERTQNLFHEPMHCLGYSHDGNDNNELNRNTVPYKTAEIFIQYLETIGEFVGNTFVYNVAEL